jgi:hypothetical protein
VRLGIELYGVTERRGKHDLLYTCHDSEKHGHGLRVDMTRLLPRLLQRIANSQSLRNETKLCPRATRKPKPVKSLRRPLPAAPSFSPSGRSQSILLDEINPVIHRKKYVRHKSFPPQVQLSRSTSRTQRMENSDRPRRMTLHERTWWSSPYCICKFMLLSSRILTVYFSVRMLSSPIRKCFFTNRYLPKGK